MHVGTAGCKKLLVDPFLLAIDKDYIVSECD